MLLIVEPDRITAELLAKQFGSNGRQHRTLIATTADEVREALQSDEPDLVLVRHEQMTDRLGDVLSANGRSPRVLVNGILPDLHDTDDLPAWADGVVRGDVPAEEAIGTVEERLSG